MEVTGYTIREALKYWNLKLEALSEQFPTTIFGFEGDEEADPSDLFVEIVEAESAIVRLQTLQQKYNLSIEVIIKDTNQHRSVMPLATAIKIAGYMGRFEKLWKTSMSTSKGRGMFGERFGGGGAETRKVDDMVAKRRISIVACRNNSLSFSKLASACRSVIAEANGTAVTLGEGEFVGFDDSLFSVL